MPNVAKCVMRVIFKDSPQGPAKCGQAAFLILLARALPAPAAAVGVSLIGASSQDPEVYVFDAETAQAVAQLLESAGAHFEYGDASVIPPLDLDRTMATINQAAQDLEDECTAKADLEAARKPSLN